MGNTLKTKAYYDVDYSTVPLSTETDSDDDINQDKVIFRKTMSDQQVKLKRPVLTIAAILAVIGVVIVCIMVAKSYNRTTVPIVLKQHKTTPNWSKSFSVESGEAPICLVDIDGDGIQDILIGTGPPPARPPQDGVPDTTAKGNSKICDSLGLPDPCHGNLYALRGFDGELLWTIQLKTDSLFMNCVDFDINTDGHTDCIVSGRYGLLEAVDVKTGKIIWSGNMTLTYDWWNVYHVAKIPDLDGDGAPEMVVATGGDIRNPPTKHDRTPGRFMMLSSKTGKLIGTRYLEIPNGRETYMSPIVYRTKDGSHYILFGSGGETVSGDLMIISLPDFYFYVTEGRKTTKLQGYYDQWPHIGAIKNKTTGIYILYNGQQKGISVPPVIADVNNDGYDDILMTAFEGRMVLFSGKDLSIIWHKEFPSMETYTTPAPGYFNDDDVLDFMIHWNLGVWISYNDTKVFILDGKDGSILWTLDGNQLVMPSDLTVRTSEPHRDLFFFRTMGRDSPVKRDATENIHGIKRLDSKPSGYFEDIDKYIKECMMRHHPHDTQPNFTGPPPDVLENLHGLPPGELQNFLNNMSVPHGPADLDRLVNNSRKILKRHVGMIPASAFQTCDPSVEMMNNIFYNRHFMCSDEADFRNELFVVDRTTFDNAVRLSNHGLEHKYYHIPSKDNSLSSNDKCTVSENYAHSTAAIGDVDGDGDLDLIIKNDKTGIKYYHDKIHTIQVADVSVTIEKINLRSALKDNGVPVSVTSKLRKGTTDKHLKDVDLLPLNQQKWTAYMGKWGNGHYTTN